MKQKKLGEIIKRYREEQRLTRKELANLLKCTAETVRLWEIGRIKPSRRNMLQLYNILGIKLGDGLYEKITDNFFKYGGRELIKKSRKLTIRRVGNRIYLNKNFQKEFTYAVEFSLHLRNKRELLIKEKSSGKSKSIYYSAEIVRKISQLVETNGNMRFLCVWDEAEEGWRGILLPEMSDSYLWKNLRKYTGQLIQDTMYRDSILYNLYRRYGKEIEYEDIGLGYELAYQFVFSADIFQEKNVWYFILMYSVALLDEMRKQYNRCTKMELSLSWNQPLKRNGEVTLQEFWIRGEIPYSIFEVEEFISWLTVFEKNILEWLLQGKNMEENISIGYNLKKMIAEGIQTMKKKAEKYYGKHYIRSLLISESKNIQ